MKLLEVSYKAASAGGRFIRPALANNTGPTPASSSSVLRYEVKDKKKFRNILILEYFEMFYIFGVS